MDEGTAAVAPRFRVARDACPSQSDGTVRSKKASKNGRKASSISAEPSSLRRASTREAFWASRSATCRWALRVRLSGASATASSARR